MPSTPHVTRLRDIPAGTDSFMCLAYALPGSHLAANWPKKDAYCVYEFTSWAVHKHELRWGDGSGQFLLSGPDQDSLILLRAFGETELDELQSRAHEAECERSDGGELSPDPAAGKSGLSIARKDRMHLDAVVCGDVDQLEARRLMLGR